VIPCASGVLDSIAEHARREAPNECCGLLIGRGGRIDRVIPLRNQATDPLRRYEIDPRDFIAALKQCRGTGNAVVGAYHSHPRGPVEPSESDRAEAFGDFLYLIAGPVADDVPLRVEAFRLENGNFRRLGLVPEPKEPEP
jgi:desampylase